MHAGALFLVALASCAPAARAVTACGPTNHVDFEVRVAPAYPSPEAVSIAAAGWMRVAPGLSLCVTRGEPGGAAITVQEGSWDLGDPTWIGVTYGRKISIRPDGVSDVSLLEHELGHALRLKHGPGIMNPFPTGLRVSCEDVPAYCAAWFPGDPECHCVAD